MMRRIATLLILITILGLLASCQKLTKEVANTKAADQPEYTVPLDPNISPADK